MISATVTTTTGDGKSVHTFYLFTIPFRRYLLRTNNVSFVNIITMYREIIEPSPVYETVARIVFFAVTL